MADELIMLSTDPDETRGMEAIVKFMRTIFPAKPPPEEDAHIYLVLYYDRDYGFRDEAYVMASDWIERFLHLGKIRSGFTAAQPRLDAWLSENAELLDKWMETLKVSPELGAAFVALRREVCE